MRKSRLRSGGWSQTLSASVALTRPSCCRQREFTIQADSQDERSADYTDYMARRSRNHNGAWPGRRWWESERSAAVKRQSDINGALPTLRMGPLHLFRLPLDLRSGVLKRANCHFSAGKVRKHFFEQF